MNELEDMMGRGVGIKERVRSVERIESIEVWRISIDSTTYISTVKSTLNNRTRYS